MKLESVVQCCPYLGMRAVPDCAASDAGLAAPEKVGGLTPGAGASREIEEDILYQAFFDVERNAVSHSGGRSWSYFI